jgi:hypothetical protein
MDHAYKGLRLSYPVQRPSPGGACAVYRVECCGVLKYVGVLIAANECMLFSARVGSFNDCSRQVSGIFNPGITVGASQHSVLRVGVSTAVIKCNRFYT